MPLVRIDMRKGRPAAFRAAVGEIVHQAMVETVNVPAADRFQIIAEHEAVDLVFDPSYLGIERSGDIVIIQITLNAGRTVALKKQLYARIAADLATQLNIRPGDVFINLVEVQKENWSFGGGVAQYATD